jgi:hypothetical protein
MHPYCPAMPGMKAIANFTHIPNMGVALLSCIISNATTKGKENMPLFPAPSPSRLNGAVSCQARLGGLLKFYQRAA